MQQLVVLPTKSRGLQTLHQQLLNRSPTGNSSCFVFRGKKWDVDAKKWAAWATKWGDVRKEKYSISQKDTTKYYYLKYSTFNVAVSFP